MNLDHLLKDHGDELLYDLLESDGKLSFVRGLPKCCDFSGPVPTECPNCSHLMVYCYDCGGVSLDPAKLELIGSPVLDDEKSNLWRPKVKCHNCSSQFWPNTDGGEGGYFDTHRNGIVSKAITLRTWVDKGYGEWISIRSEEG